MSTASPTFFVQGKLLITKSFGLIELLAEVLKVVELDSGVKIATPLFQPYLDLLGDALASLRYRQALLQPKFIVNSDAALINNF